MPALRAKFVGQERLANPFGEYDSGAPAGGLSIAFGWEPICQHLRTVTDWWWDVRKGTGTGGRMLAVVSQTLQTSLGQGPPAPRHRSLPPPRSPLQALVDIPRSCEIRFPLGREVAAAALKTCVQHSLSQSRPSPRPSPSSSCPFIRNCALLPAPFPDTWRPITHSASSSCGLCAFLEISTLHQSEQAPDWSVGDTTGAVQKKKTTYTWIVFTQNSFSDKCTFATYLHNSYFCQLILNFRWLKKRVKYKSLTTNPPPQNPIQLEYFLCLLKNLF